MLSLADFSKLTKVTSNNSWHEQTQPAKLKSLVTVWRKQVCVNSLQCCNPSSATKPNIITLKDMPSTCHKLVQNLYKYTCLSCDLSKIQLKQLHYDV